MGVMRALSREYARRRYLRASQWIGRDGRCELRLDFPGVSEVHASLTWDGRRWLLRDRNSTNGTFVNRVKLGLAPAALARGDRVAFGAEDIAFVLEDDGPPGLLLEALDGTHTIHVSADDGIALLPSAEEPLVTVLRNASGQWRLETATDAWTLTSDSEIRVGERLFRAIVPSPHDATGGGETRAPGSLFEAELEIGVTPIEEEADLTLRLGEVSHRIVDRVPLYLLALLARARGAGGGDGEPAAKKTEGLADDEGWIAVEEARRQLDVSPELLNLHVYRIRQSLRALGIADADAIIERRKGRMRLGLDPSRVRIVRTP
jgi:pSer/pThr/pTyr-binding forkhead associated (FHA) protein